MTSHPNDPANGAMMDQQALNAIHEFLGIAQKKIYPQPDKPDSDWAKLKAAVDGLALLSASAPAMPQDERIATLERMLAGERGQVEIWMQRAKEWCDKHAVLRAALDAAPAAPAQSAEPVATVRTHTTQAGESVMGIALRQCGDEMEWRHLLACNPEFSDMHPHEYFPVGTVLTLPPAAPQPSQPVEAHGYCDHKYINGECKKCGCISAGE